MNARPEPGSGFFLSFEGTDGAGKGTQIRLLARRLERLSPLLVREPGGTRLGEQVRSLVLHTQGQVVPAAEMYLYMAARAQLVDEVIRPALAAGRLVIADRYHDSTLAYQGCGRGLEVGWPRGFPRPDLTILLDVPPEVAAERLASAGRERDRLEREAEDFHRRVRNGYLELAAAEPDRFVVIDAGRPPTTIHQDVLTVVETALTAAGHPDKGVSTSS